MDFLRNLFGNLSATFFRLVLVVGTLAAVYLFAIKPVLDTTEEISSSISNSTNNALQQSIRQTQQQIRQSVRQTTGPGPIPRRGRLPGTIQIRRTVRGLTPAQANRLSRCIRRAGGQLPAINACFDRFENR